MDTTVRTVAKAVTWQVSGLAAMTLIAYLLTGSIEAGGSIALTSTLCGFVAFFVHEKLWSWVRWGRVAAGPGRC